jgi:hypothetical protein
MTVHYEIPVVRYLGNGVTTDFTFTWSSADPTENYVTLDDVLLLEGDLYELEEYEPLHGGVMRFNDPPAVGAEILVYRQTPITQEVDYVDFEAFPADTHEFQMDKDTRILQEMIFGGRAIGGPVDLTAVQYPDRVVIENSAGTDATLLPWTCDGLLAGVQMSEVIPYGGSGPVDGQPSDTPDSFIWWFLGPAPQVGGDPNIVMGTTPLDINITQPAPTVATARFRYNAVTGDIEYGYDPLGSPWTIAAGLTTPPAGLLEYWIRFDLLDGGVNSEAGSLTATWIDAYSTIGEINEWMGWWVQDAGTVAATASAIFTLAPDDGMGAPDVGQAISRYITLRAEQI